MTLRHLRIFCMVCKTNYNTTRAAEELNMAQPAVSLAIKELEQYYGIVLFDRIGRRLHITSAGENFLQYALRICAQFDDLERVMKNWDSMGILRVGASITIGSQFLPGYVKAFNQKYPKTEIHVTVAPVDDLEKLLMNNELDFALIEGVSRNPAMYTENYMTDYLSITVSAKGNYRQGEKISVEEFSKQKFLLREHGSGTRDIFDTEIAKAGISVKPIWEATSTTALVNAVIHGLGIAVLPYRMIQRPLKEGKIITIEVEGLDFSRNFYIIYHKDKYLTRSAVDFISLCKDYEAEDSMYDVRL